MKPSFFKKHFLKHPGSAKPSPIMLQRVNADTKKRDGIRDFIRTGVFSLSFVLLMAGAVYLLQNTVTVTSSPNGKELPIYCVDRDDNKIAISFDAAWGNGNLRKAYSADAGISRYFLFLYILF